MRIALRRCLVTLVFFASFSLPNCVAPAAAADPGDTADVPTTPEPIGLIRPREPWTTSRITGSPDPPAPYRVARAFPKLRFDKPVELVAAPGTNRLFLVELDGKIYSFPNDADCDQADLFLDVAEAVPGTTRVYGLAFHPDFETNHYAYVCYVLAAELPQGTHVSRFRVTADDPPRCDPRSEQVVIRWKSGGHNGGCLKFGPDGYLYISTGDGASPNPPDPLETGQDISDLLASILRIDVDRRSADRGYAIPEDNPFVDLEGARGEVWAYGFRNPWRMSFDSTTGDLWLGDVGWELWEMVQRVQPGGNYGWSVVEGTQSVKPETRRGPHAMLPPTAAHPHTEARSITGGYVYRGKRFPDLVGAYIYGDYVTGKIWALRRDPDRVTSPQELVDTALPIICFGEDRDGELFVVDHVDSIYHLVPSGAAEANRDFPRRLSESGIFALTALQQPAAGVVPYSINVEPWSDYAVADRYLALPGAGQISTEVAGKWNYDVNRWGWDYPRDAVLVKTLSLGLKRGHPESLRRVETQLLHFDGEAWRGYSYAWNDAQTDAVLVEADGFERTFTIDDPQAPAGQRHQTWRFHSRTECAVCHNPRAGSALGMNYAQLNHPHSFGGAVVNQLTGWEQMGLFAQRSPRPPDKLPRLTRPFDTRASLGRRARAYVHVNCAHCHRRGGGGTAPFELREDLALAKTNILGVRPSLGAFGIAGAEILAPGEVPRSVLYYRMATIGPGRMPKLGSNHVDRQGLRLVHDWIRSLPPAQPRGASQNPAQRAATDAAAKLTRLAGQQVAGPTTTELVRDILSTTPGAVMLLGEMEAGRLGPQIRQQAIAVATQHADVQIRGLFERFVPEDQRTRRLGSVIDPAEILAIDGAAPRGEAFFFSDSAAQCKTCHRVGRNGGAVGPDLSEIGKKYDRARLLETILEPSKLIEPRYVAYVAETVDGEVYTGLLQERNSKVVVLKDAQDREIRIPKGDVDLLVPQEKSLMPQLLLRDMTPQQAADLLAYLSSLK